MKFGFAHPCYAALLADRLFGLMADVKDEAATQAHPRPVTTRGRTVCRLVFPCYDSSFYAHFQDTRREGAVEEVRELKLGQESEEQGDIVDALMGQSQCGIHGAAPTTGWERRRCTAAVAAAGSEWRETCKHGACRKDG